MNKLQNQKGFTIIEVVLVLAIAGLIFLMVFIALPALQRSQRDSGRKNDASTVSAAVQSYSSNNRGNMPEESSDIRSYIDDLSQFDDANSVVVQDSADGKPNDEQIFVFPGRTCGDNGDTENGSSRQSAVVVKLEAGSDVYYCVQS